MLCLSFTLSAFFSLQLHINLERSHWPRVRSSERNWNKSRWFRWNQFCSFNGISIYLGIWKGVTSWMQPTTDEVQSSASTLAKSLPQLTPFILSPTATFRQITVNRVDVGLWNVSGQTLVLATNMNYFSVSISLKDLGLSSPQPTARQIINIGVQMDSSRENLMFDSIGTGAFIVKSWRPGICVIFDLEPT